MGIDHVPCPRDAQQFANAPGGGVVKGSDINATEHSRQVGLPRHAAPHLSNDTTAGDHGSATELIPVNEGPYLPIVALNGYKCASVENQCHSASPPGGAGCRLLLRLVEDAISLRKLFLGEGAILSLPGRERLA
jgi:hypothetical protein